MRIFILEDKQDTVGVLTKIVAAVKAMEVLPPIRIYLVADGEHAWELAAGLGLSGVLKRHYTIDDTTLRRLPLK